MWPLLGADLRRSRQPMRPSRLSTVATLDGSGTGTTAPKLPVKEEKPGAKGRMVVPESL